MSDSDSDDFLEEMSKVGSRTSLRRAQATVEQRLAALDMALAAEDKNRKFQTRLMQLKAEEQNNGEDTIKQAEERLKQHASTKPAQRRQATYNSIHGIDDMDLNDGLTDGKRMALKTAADTDKSTMLGTRPTLQYMTDPAELYCTSDDAIKALKEILKSKDLKNHVIGKKLIALTPNIRNLTLFLSKPSLMLTAMKKHRMTNLPHSLSQWLFYLACSRDESVMELSRAAFCCLHHIWKNTLEPADDTVLVLADLDTQLSRWFGLTVGETRGQSKDEDKDHTDDMIKGTVSSLRRWLILWGVLFRNCLVPGTDNFGETATRCIVALVQVGLDPILVHSADVNG